MNLLSKAEMKNVMGGGVTCVISVNGGGSNSYPCGSTAANCQDMADANCDASDACDDVDCN